MGPQLYRCGNFKARKEAAVNILASMGPQLYRCGNVVDKTSEDMEFAALQWGRNFIVAEMSWDYPTCVGVVLASMRPQLYRCGNSAVAGVRATNTSASMRPQLYRCGNICGTCGSRSYRPASMGPQLYRCGNQAMAAAVRTGLSVLQWGRNFIVAEMRFAEHQCRRAQVASMGPQLYRCRNKLPDNLAFKGKASKLQWGRNFIVAEI